MLLFFIVLPPVSFRPLSGSYISQLNSHICSLNVCGLFPSPIGELHFSMLQLMLHHRNTQSFRPLSGSYISQYFISCVCLLFIFVSVPYRGATFLNCNNKKSLELARWGKVSVPYRGATFLNNVYTLCRFAIYRFPSPIGELHFSIYESRSIVTSTGVSVPYRGATFLNKIVSVDEAIRLLTVSVPYRGATFLN